jgi:hypothetical protein
MSVVRNTLSMSAIAAVLLIGATALAQGTQQRQQRAPQAAPQTQQQTGDISEKDIQAFAVAANEIRQLRQKWAPQMQAAQQQSPEAKQQVETQAFAEMTGAVEKSGLSVDKYNKISEQAQSDPDLRQKIQSKLKP